LNGGAGLAAGPNVDAGQTYEPGWVASDDVYIAPTNANLTCFPPYNTWTNTSDGGQENKPITCMNWYEAAAFCIWDGGFLPTESEREYAAAGGSEELEYPWGSTTPGTACPGTGCDYAIYNCDYPNGSGTCTGATNIAPVGTALLGAGRWGQLDLAGEVWEWDLDWYRPYANPCVDCAQFTESAYRIIRGGYFTVGASGLLPPSRGHYPPTYRHYDLGFRCARVP
jgi:formylglycine-generating enzyme required for sulfatase activity